MDNLTMFWTVMRAVLYVWTTSCWSSSSPAVLSKEGGGIISSAAPLSFFLAPAPPGLSSELGAGGGLRGRRGTLLDLYIEVRER